MFVTRKITLGVSKIACGIIESFELGNLNARRDWSHAEDMMRGIYSIMQTVVPQDYVLASGTSRSVREFAEEAFKVIGVDIT